jgi:hypothetical protein
MTKIDFGVGMSMPVRPSKRKEAERFCREILGLPQTLESEEYSCFKFPNGQILGITPHENAPTEVEYENSIWLEMVTSNFEETKAKLFGVREVQGGIKEAFFFNVPGGAVFRLLSEEMAAEQAQ